MARSASQLLARLWALTPQGWRSRGLLALFSGTLAKAEETTEDLAKQTVPSTAEGKWLRALARDDGVRTTGDMGDDEVRLLMSRGRLGITETDLQRLVDRVLDGTGYSGRVVPDHLTVPFAFDATDMDDPDDLARDLYAYASRPIFMGRRKGISVFVPHDLPEDLQRQLVEALRSRHTAQDIVRLQGTDDPLPIIAKANAAP